MRFYLGTDRVHWLAEAGVRLFVSHRSLRSRRRLPRASASWALDSGAFSELSRSGNWETSAREYARAARRYADEIGMLEFASPQDWMCEPWILERTGLSVAEHQRRTVASVLELRSLGLAAIPVLQGWEPEDYVRCVELYGQAGVALAEEPIVGLGTVCRRQSTLEGERVVLSLARLGLRLHGFGVKITGLRRYGYLLRSADSMAWSYAGRRAKREQEARGEGRRCIHGRSAAHCLNCAIAWRDRVIEPRWQQTHLEAVG